MTNQLDRYLTQLALRRSTEKSGEINVSILLSLEERHQPRIQEIVRLLSKMIADIAESYPTDDIDESEMLINRAEKVVAKVEDLAKDGLSDLYVESSDLEGELE